MTSSVADSTSTSELLEEFTRRRKTKNVSIIRASLEGFSKTYSKLYFKVSNKQSIRTLLAMDNKHRELDNSPVDIADSDSLLLRIKYEFDDSFTNKYFKMPVVLRLTSHTYNGQQYGSGYYYKIINVCLDQQEKENQIRFMNL